MKIAKVEQESIDSTRVKTLAYQLWEKAGSPPGRDLEFWLKAEAKIAEEQAPAKPAATSAHITAKARPTANRLQFPEPQHTPRA